MKLDRFRDHGTGQQPIKDPGGRMRHLWPIGHAQLEEISGSIWRICVASTAQPRSPMGCRAACESQCEVGCRHEAVAMARKDCDGRTGGDCVVPRRVFVVVPHLNAIDRALHSACDLGPRLPPWLTRPADTLGPWIPQTDRQIPAWACSSRPRLTSIGRDLDRPSLQ